MMCGTELALAGISAAVSAFGAVQQAGAQKARARFQAGVARNNQILFQRAADDRRKQGDAAERQYRLKVADLIARQRVGFAASGVLVNDPGSSPQNALLDTRTLEAADLSTLRENARKEVASLRFQGANAGARAGLLAASARASSPLLAGSLGLLRSAPGLYGEYKRLP